LRVVGVHHFAANGTSSLAEGVYHGLVAFHSVSRIHGEIAWSSSRISLRGLRFNVFVLNLIFSGI
jgi:hypothetical protein